MTSLEAPKPTRSLGYLALHGNVFVSIVASVKPKGTIRSIIVSTSSDAETNDCGMCESILYLTSLLLAGFHIHTACRVPCTHTSGYACDCCT